MIEFYLVWVTKLQAFATATNTVQWKNSSLSIIIFFELFPFATHSYNSLLWAHTNRIECCTYKWKVERERDMKNTIGSGSSGSSSIVEVIGNYSRESTKITSLCAQFNIARTECITRDGFAIGLFIALYIYFLQSQSQPQQ